MDSFGCTRLLSQISLPYQLHMQCTQGHRDALIPVFSMTNYKWYIFNGTCGVTISCISLGLLVSESLSDLSNSRKSGKTSLWIVSATFNKGNCILLNPETKRQLPSTDERTTVDLFWNRVRNSDLNRTPKISHWTQGEGEPRSSNHLLVTALLTSAGLWHSPPSAAFKQIGSVMPVRLLLI